MQDDTQPFDHDPKEESATDFVDYQHKKLERVAEIIKEEERAAKLIAESQKTEKSPMKTKVVIDSIVKHEPAADQIEEGLVIQMPEDLSAATEVDQQVAQGFDHTEASNDELVLDEDQATFDAIEKVVQESQNDFNVEIDESEPDLAIVEIEDLEQMPVSDQLAQEANSEVVDLPELDIEEGQIKAELSTPLPENDLAIETFELGNEVAETEGELGDGVTDQRESLQEDEVLVDAPLVDEAAVDFVAAETMIEAEKAENAQAVIAPAPNVSKIGKLLLELGKISRSDTKKILRAQKKHGLLFGDAALKLGLINDEDIQKVVAMQFNYHYLQAGQGDFSDDLVAAYAPFSKKVENYRALRSQLMMRWFKKGQRALAIVGANSSDGVSYLTANLGVVFSQLGARTLIIEANMRAPRQKEIFNIRNNAGLSDIIVGKVGNDAIEEIDSIPDLSVLHAGTVPPNPQELLGRTSFNILMKTLMDSYDVILIDTPPVVQSADAQSVIEIAEGAMLVSRLDHTRQSDVLEVRHHIEMTGASIISAVMNTF